MATTQQFLPAQAPIADASNQFTVTRPWLLFFQHLLVQSANAGSVTHTGDLTLNELILGNGGADIKAVPATNGQVPIGKTSDGSVTLARLTAGSGVTITNGAGSITIAAVGGGGISQLTGDVLAGPGSGSQVATIAAKAVTFAKMQDIPEHTVIGRNSSGPGTPEAVTTSQALDWLGT